MIFLFGQWSQARYGLALAKRDFGTGVNMNSTGFLVESVVAGLARARRFISRFGDSHGLWRYIVRSSGEHAFFAAECTSES